MILKSQAKITFSGIENPRDRLWLSAGTNSPDETLAPTFFPGARIPKLPWRRPSDAEYTALVARPGEWNPGSSLALLRLEPEMLLPYQQLGLEELSSIEDYMKLYNHPALKTICAEVLENLTREYSLLQSSRNKAFAIAVSAAGLVTLAKAPVEPTQSGGPRALIGLHFDSDGASSVAQAHQAENRMAINLGREDRWLLYVNLPVAEVAALLYPSVDLADLYPDLEMANDFLTQHPDYPVVKVQMRPGEAYIAPTGNVIHDGSSVGATHPDVSAHFLGDFAP